LQLPQKTKEELESLLISAIKRAISGEVLGFELNLIERATYPILFNTEMVEAILDGRKTMTRRTKNYKYRVGDILWVKETFCYKHWCEPDDGCLYKADEWAKNTDEFKWSPSMYMPKNACRIWLRVVDIKRENLHDISRADAIREGVKSVGVDLFNNVRYKCYLENKDAVADFLDPVESFNSLWIKINGKESFEANPTVTVITFERCNMPDGFLK
jgi:hypothetical protein